MFLLAVHTVRCMQIFAKLCVWQIEEIDTSHTTLDTLNATLACLENVGILLGVFSVFALCWKWVYYVFFLIGKKEAFLGSIDSINLSEEKQHTAKQRNPSVNPRMHSHTCYTVSAPCELSPVSFPWRKDSLLSYVTCGNNCWVFCWILGSSDQLQVPDILSVCSTNWQYIYNVHKVAKGCETWIISKPTSPALNLFINMIGIKAVFYSFSKGKWIISTMCFSGGLQQ